MRFRTSDKLKQMCIRDSLYSLADSKSTQVTDGMSDAVNPVFDKDGKYLYFTASTNSGESLGLDVHAVEHTSTSSIYLAVLDKAQSCLLYTSEAQSTAPYRSRLIIFNALSAATARKRCFAPPKIICILRDALH